MARRTRSWISLSRSFRTQRAAAEEADRILRRGPTDEQYLEVGEQVAMNRGLGPKAVEEMPDEQLIVLGAQNLETITVQRSRDKRHWFVAGIIGGPHPAFSRFPNLLG